MGRIEKRDDQEVSWFVSGRRVPQTGDRTLSGIMIMICTRTVIRNGGEDQLIDVTFVGRGPIKASIQPMASPRAESSRNLW
jgi:hypothetical protein